jgi:hypothetical protein
MAFAIQASVRRTIALLATREESAEQRAETQQSEKWKRRSCLGELALRGLIVALARGGGCVLVRR